jgi:hypothetical protein
MDGKPEGPVQPGQIFCTEPFGLALSQAHPNDPFPALDFVVEGNGIASDVESAGEAIELPPYFILYQF